MTKLNQVVAAYNDPMSAQNEALFQAVQRLHLRAGKPSTRSLAEISGMSHTTVHAVLRIDPRAPTWLTLAKVIAALDGDPEEYRDLWMATQGIPKVRSEPGDAFRGYKRSMVKLDLQLAKILEHLGVPDVTDTEIDNALNRRGETTTNGHT